MAPAARMSGLAPGSSGEEKSLTHASCTPCPSMEARAPLLPLLLPLLLLLLLPLLLLPLLEVACASVLELE